MFLTAYHNGALAVIVHRLGILAIAALLLFCTITLADASRRWTDFKVEPAPTAPLAVVIEPEQLAAADDLPISYKLAGPRRLREIVRLVAAK
ncbi:MAG: hypothetical protein AAF266_01690 [Planctomycetota bacterium]